MRSKLPKEASMTLNKLSIDDLSSVLQCLHGGAIIRLYQSGDTLLRLKMRQGAVTTMILSDTRPFSVSRFPPCLPDFQMLRTLKMSRMHPENEFIPLCSGGSIATEIRKLSKSLKHLSVSSFDSPLILLPPWIAVESFNSPDHKTKALLACSYVNHPEALSNYLPNLESLELFGPGHFSLYEFHLPLLPPSLLSLTLANMVFVDLKNFQALPRGLTRLRLGSSISISPASAASLPPDLTELMAYTSWDADSLLALPPSLTHLSTSTKGFGLRELSSLPRDLMACSFQIPFVRAEDVLVLPPRLTVLKESYGDTHRDVTPPGMIWDDEMLQKLPKTLTKLELSSPVTITNKNAKLVLPPLLTHLEMKGHFTADGKALSTLERFHTLHIDGTATFENSIFTLPSSLETWRVNNDSTIVDSLPKTLAMLGLRDMKILSSAASSSLRTLTKLHTLGLGNEVDGSVMEHFPPSLGYLACTVSKNVLTGLKWLSKSIITDLTLTMRENLTAEISRALPATLETLCLETGNERPTKEAFAALPINLTELEMFGLASPEICTENILAHLPRGLVSLTLDLQIDWRHLVDLPPYLDRFGLEALLVVPEPEADELDELLHCFEKMPRNLELIPPADASDMVTFIHTRWVAFQRDRNLAWMQPSKAPTPTFRDDKKGQARH